MRTGQHLWTAITLVKNDPGPFIVGNLVMVLMMMLLPGIALLVLMGPYACGMMYISFKALRGDKPALGDVFKGFRNFLDAMIAGAIYSTALAVGFVFCVLPAFAAAGLLVWMFPLIVHRKMPFHRAVLASIEIASKDMLGFAMFMLIVIVVQASGAMLLCAGALLTLPVGWCAVASAYSDMAMDDEVEPKWMPL
jgi:uncharacterized membrane protein